MYRAYFKNCTRYYQYRDRLGSSTIEANESGQVISYEEYYPYGATAYRAAASGVDLSLKRYRFTGKERDEETGLDYFGVRYYASWLGRWTSGDPGGFVDGLNLYRYTRNNPVNGVDREGYSTEEVERPKNQPSTDCPDCPPTLWGNTTTSSSETSIPYLPSDQGKEFSNNYTDFIDSLTEINDAPNALGAAADEVIVTAKKRPQGETKITSTTIDSREEGLVTASTTWYWHQGNEYLDKGWYENSDYVLGNLDYANGQILPPKTTFDVVTNLSVHRTVESDGYNYGVDDDGYLNGNIYKHNVMPDLGISSVGKVAKVGRLLKAAQTATKIRSARGIAMGTGKALASSGKWLRGSQGNAGVVPKSVADGLRGKSFSSFSSFRESFWKAAAADQKLLGQFSKSNQTLMKSGRAPLVVKSQQTPGHKTYELHHRTPIQHGGGVYDVDNIMIVTPRFHQEVLLKSYHY